MSYIPTEWQTGDIVTAEKLNKLEEGVAASGGGGGGGLVVNVTWDEEGTTATLDKNYNEIRAALSSGIPVLGITLYEAEGDTKGDISKISGKSIFT